MPLLDLARAKNTVKQHRVVLSQISRMEKDRKVRHRHSVFPGDGEDKEGVKRENVLF